MQLMLKGRKRTVMENMEEARRVLVALVLFVQSWRVASLPMPLEDGDFGPADFQLIDEPPCRATIFSDYMHYPRQKGPVEMSDAVADICGKYGYSTTMIPNLMLQSSQASALEAYRGFNQLQQTNCSSNLEFFLCLYYFPLYTHGNNRFPTMPQRSLCEEIKGSCLHALQVTGKDWPQHFQCDKLPAESAMCNGEFYPAISTPPSELVEQSMGAEDVRGPESDLLFLPTMIPVVSEVIGTVTPATTTEDLSNSAYRHWQRGPDPSETASQAYSRATCRLFGSSTTVKEMAPPDDRDVISTLGYPQTEACCNQCAAGVKSDLRAMNTRNDTSKWSWAFYGSVIEANVIVISSRRVFTLTVRIDHILEQSAGILRLGNNMLRISGGMEGECVCARPDNTSSNLFMGKTQILDGANVHEIHRMDAIWPQPLRRSPPKPFRKWRRLVHAKQRAASFNNHHQQHLHQPAGHT